MNKRLQLSSQFRLYVVSPYWKGEPPFVITTVVVESRMGPTAEWFLVVPGVPGKSLPHRSLRINNVGALVEFGSVHEHFNADESIILDYAAELAGYAIQSFIFDQHRTDTTSREFDQFPSLSRLNNEETAKTLAFYWFRGNCIEDLKWIYENTQCTPLQTFIEDLDAYQPIR